MKHGLKDEKTILRLYETGFVISQIHPFLGASPDGEVDGGLVEIKRIFSGDLSLKDEVCKRGICKDTTLGLVINKNHKFYYQVQQLMLCTGCSWTDLVQSDTVNLIILHVKKDNRFLPDEMLKLEQFYLAYPRVADGLTRLSKLNS